MIVINDKGGIKRIWLKEIINNNRPVKGDTLFTKKKSNPLSIKHIVATQTYDEITLIDDKINKVISKDVPLMSKDSTFSNMLSLTKGWYLQRSLDEIRIVDIVEDDVKKDQEDKDAYDGKASEDFEFISFDV